MVTSPDKDSSQALARLEARYKAIVETAVDAIVTIDIHSKIESFNHAAESMFGYAREEVIGQNVKLLMPEDIAQVHDRYLENYLKSGQSGAIGIKRELMARRKDGTLFPIELALTYSSVNGYQFFTGMIYDITKRKQVEDALSGARLQAENSNLAKSVFMSNMSHEIRTPLNAILGFTQLLKVDNALTEEQRDNISEIERAGKHVLTLVNDILELEKIESGKIDIRLNYIDTSSIINECQAFVRSMSVDKGIALECQFEGIEPGAIYADERRLKQVVLNLLSNAIKYGDNKGVTIRCETVSRDRIRISVKDRGNGILPEKQAALFTPYNRLGAEEGSIEGSGIGLVISKRLIEAMHGSIGFNSNPGQGSEFWIELPYLANHNAKAQPGKKAGKSKQILDKPLEHRRILYVEDNPANLRLVQKAFEGKVEFSVTGVHNAEEAMAFMEDQPPDIILMDINLPGMSGYEAIKIIQEDRKLQHIPIIAISASASKDDIERGLQSGFSHYLTKPIDLMRLFALVAA